jgi:hypothetical protein
LESISVPKAKQIGLHPIDGNTLHFTAQAFSVLDPFGDFEKIFWLRLIDFRQVKKRCAALF